MRVGSDETALREKAFTRSRKMVPEPRINTTFYGLDRRVSQCLVVEAVSGRPFGRTKKVGRQTSIAVHRIDRLERGWVKGFGVASGEEIDRR